MGSKKSILLKKIRIILVILFLLLSIFIFRAMVIETRENNLPETKEWKVYYGLLLSHFNADEGGDDGGLDPKTGKKGSAKGASYAFSYAMNVSQMQFLALMPHFWFLNPVNIRELTPFKKEVKRFNSMHKGFVGLAGYEVAIGDDYANLFEGEKGVTEEQTGLLLSYNSSLRKWEKVYEWAKTPEGAGLLEQMPCYCGCKYEGHKHVRHCYWRDDGSFDKHGITCSVCFDIAKKTKD